MLEMEKEVVKCLETPWEKGDSESFQVCQVLVLVAEKLRRVDDARYDYVEHLGALYHPTSTSLYRSNAMHHLPTQMQCITHLRRAAQSAASHESPV